jgi:hypothetical protein
VPSISFALPAVLASADGAPTAVGRQLSKKLRSLRLRLGYVTGGSAVQELAQKRPRAQVAMREKTVRLRALRLARDLAEKAPALPAKNARRD